MDANTLRRRLFALCAELDRGGPLGAGLGLAAVVGLSTGALGCAGHQMVEEGVGLYGAPPVEREVVIIEADEPEAVNIEPVEIEHEVVALYAAPPPPSMLVEPAPEEPQVPPVEEPVEPVEPEGDGIQD